MKRTFALVALLAALGVLCKLTLKEAPSAGADSRTARAIGTGTTATTSASIPDPEAELRAQYTDPKDRALVERTLAKYRHNALAIERTDGLRGLALLDRLDLEAIYLYEKYPGDFRRLRDSLSDDAAAELLLHWREYFGLKRADDVDRAILIAEIARLSPRQRRVAARYPNALPLVLADPDGVTELCRALVGRPCRPCRCAGGPRLRQPRARRGRPSRGPAARSTITARSPSTRSGSRGSMDSRW